MKILITGTSGHLGEAIARQLKANHRDYIGLDLNPSEFTTHTGSITNTALVNSLVNQVDFIIHTATLHKPHVGTHASQDFIDTNITGTLTLLEAARKANIKGFIYTSTTSTFGDTLTPKPNEPAIWITEKTIGLPKNIYGVTKSAAEDLCQIFCRNHKLPCLVLKTSRFFPEEDDKKSIRENYQDLNIKATEYLYRRVDVEDVVTAHLLAIDKVQEIGFGKYIISSTSPFEQQHLTELHTDASAVVEKIFPDFRTLFAKKGWTMLPKIDRVYVNEKARCELGWKPKYDFGYVLDCIAAGKDFRSQLSLDVGIKGYHAETFTEGPYPVLDI
ncbi:NAD-dependent epimerase/dehydratase family protein [Pedobacter zeae]|uniref:NAD-dependent epimerase n=1 Tax=Pedobacter zeae TaxID=1737356 RepID=A0A7W6K858_9SPHI|nr:NAD(P)-dependent oxidoreductase [Pedobacter zeae]MBB4106919.1 nucleoside-diphosphate-sugar epimerase [Pedobacter zeae]GGH04585.1 NAD-dependent epimerase [Pedobacter zeae]